MPAPKMPALIRVGYRDYRVETVTNDDLGEYQGECNKFKARIRILDGLPKFDAAETLLHEVLHACWNRVSLEGHVEENAVTVLSEALSQVIRDNPDLIGWLQHSLA